MDTYSNLILDDDYRVKISSKRLKSGKYQVKFEATLHNGKELYGYLLVSPAETLKKVVEKIKARLHFIDVGDHFYLSNSSLESYTEPNFMIFQ
ncbi:MAG: hypothetical protein AAGA66_19285 [Bacteroidota bacterium]